LADLADNRLLRSAHDCSDGGLGVALAECCFDTGGIGAEVDVDAVRVGESEAINRAATLFGESASRVVVSVAPADLTAVLERAARAGVPARTAGRTGGTRLRLTIGGESGVDLSVDEAESVWAGALEGHSGQRVA
jgi:phosphoribosylformylglycinamidine synthase